ncbi:hypothetical protein E8E14_009632 [Neopestalotiopsis sp. 37M]|nr:hypothetical protein E8E14_009632 [Neopestalotiopsis sp. 37M]
MANNNNNNNNFGQGPFWDFVRSFDANPQRAGAGVDHASGGQPPFGAGFPFGGPGSFNPWHGGHWGGPWGPPPPPGGDFPWGHRGGRHGRHGRHHHRRGDSDSDREGEESEGHDFENMDESPDTMRDDAPPPPPPPGGPHPPHPPHHAAGSPHPPPPHHEGPGPRHHHGRHRHGSRGPGGPGAFRRGSCRGRGGPRGRHGPPHGGPPPPPFGAPFDLRSLMGALAGHPAAQALRGYFEPQDAAAREAGEQSGEQQDDDSFVPPVDTFNTEKAYVLHVALPGAVKEDVGVNWDADKSQLNIAGVVYRPGNEEFLQSLSSGERKVGMFERSIRLPPANVDDKDEVDGFGITAKMENGILIITVPKAEKEWTEIHKVDIQ